MNNTSKDRILKTTVNLYAYYGINGVSMSQVASELQISKKTLYAEFSNKEELLSACIDYELERLNCSLNRIEKEALNPVDAIILITSDLIRYKTCFCPAFYRDLNRFQYPLLKINNYLKELVGRYRIYFQKGKQEEYFQPELDCEVMSTIFIEQLIDKKSSHQSVMIFTFLRGICTQQGLNILSNYTPATIKKNIYDYN